MDVQVSLGTPRLILLILKLTAMQTFNNFKIYKTEINIFLKINSKLNQCGFKELRWCHIRKPCMHQHGII
jgi:hypothetical protein